MKGKELEEFTHKWFMKIIKGKPKNKKEEQLKLNVIKFYLKTKYEK